MKKLLIALSVLLCATFLIVSCKIDEEAMTPTSQLNPPEIVVGPDIDTQQGTKVPVTIAPDASTEEPTGTTEEPAGTTSSKETTSPTETKDPVVPSDPTGTTEELTQTTEPAGTTEPGAPDFDITEDENGGYSNLVPF